ncbi:MAG: hypothetical protein KDG89_04480 [Geminicoccaceae bacterium]|nr:hypothetical protein [Geminicoccaceae bacterium]
MNREAAPRAGEPPVLRAPETVMRLERLGANHQTRLSFMRALLRRLKAEGWRVTRPVWEIDAKGVGRAVYVAEGPTRSYGLVAFAHDLPDDERTDRVIAEAWDATFALFDGVPTAADLDRMAANVPLQEAGRCAPSELVLSRANRSVRLFAHVVDRLARGLQPERAELEKVGYLMRTTAVYGNGKFGIADRERIADRPEFAGPFRAEMLAVWLIRAFTVDLAEHAARMLAPGTAVRLDPDLRRRLGVGNSTGLGMAPFLVNHPALLHRWLLAKETALARVRAVEHAAPEAAETFPRLVGRARRTVGEWRVADARYAGRIARLEDDLARLSSWLEAGALDGPYPFDRLYRRAEEALSIEAQELLVSLLLEPHGGLVDDLAETMSADEEAPARIDGRMSLADLRRLIEDRYAWALGVDYAKAEAQARFWYVSAEKLEPRLGERGRESGHELEQPLAVGRDVAALRRALGGAAGTESVAAFLLRHPEHRHVVRRVQLHATHPYAEIQGNLIDAGLVPLDLLRCKLAFFGASKFDPRSDRWLRITMYQDAPYPDELDRLPADDWCWTPAG